MTDLPTIDLPADTWEDYLPPGDTYRGWAEHVGQKAAPLRSTVEVETLPIVAVRTDADDGWRPRDLVSGDRVQLVRPLTDIERTMVKHGIPRGSDDPQAQALGAPPLHQLGSEGVPVGTATVAAIDDHIGTAPDHDWRYLVTLTDVEATTDE